MQPFRKLSVTAGVLFVLATICSLTGNALIPTLRGTGYLLTVAEHSTRMAVGLLLSLMAAGCSVGIAVALYPALKHRYPGLAIGSVVFRAIESVFYTVGVVALLSVLSEARDLATASASPRATDLAVSDSLVALHDRAAVVAVISFVVGGLLYYIAFYRSGLVPRWISGWGIAAMPLMLTACLLALFNDQPVTRYVLLAAPIGVQEFVFAGWLIARGLPPVTTTPSPPPTPPDASVAAVRQRNIPAGEPTTR